MVGMKLEDLEARMDSLERENRWLKRTGALAVGFTMFALALGTSWGGKPKQITTESLVLTDPYGNTRARLEVRPDGAPTLALLGRNGRDQVLLRASMNGTSSLDYFEGQTLRASFNNVASSGSDLMLSNSNGRTTAKMFVSQEGASGIAFQRDLRGIGLNVGADGTSQLKFADRRGQTYDGMKLEPDGTLSVLGRPENPALLPSATTTHRSGPLSEELASRRSSPVFGDRLYQAP